MVVYVDSVVFTNVRELWLNSNSWLARLLEEGKKQRRQPSRGTVLEYCTSRRMIPMPCAHTPYRPNKFAQGPIAN